MNHRFLNAAVLATALLIISFVVAVGVSRAASHAKAPSVKASPPSAPCDFQHRMDVAVIDGVWFECSCEALMVGTVCDWYEITSPAKDPDSARKVKAARKHHRLIVIHALPAVVS